MFKKFGKKSFVCVELTDYVFRLLYKESVEDTNFSVFELALNEGLVTHGQLLNELELFDLLKKTLSSWGMRKKDVRFFVPDQSVLMRPIDVPEEVQSANLRGFVEMEIGNSIHLPFDNPLFDVYDADPADGKAILFASPEEDVRGLADLYDDSSLHSKVAEIRMLANGRFLKKTNVFSTDDSYLVADWSINGLSVGIFTNNELEFLRFQEIDSQFSQWKAEETKDKKVTFEFSGTPFDYDNQLIDQVGEIGRIINFYRFSLHKGDRTIEKIILMGDNPKMNLIREQTEQAQEQNVIVIDDMYMDRFYPNLNGRHAALVGLALRGGE
ncbi:pilus assembly protein PilM [Filibacter tadaridae]|uniref:Competence protein A n=1 Tax=Filibacter tadaridae TaxID=2483811 RepID=A0A3P5XLR5_9BACL|nr:pilus assembly protein PilM [Filibacter tadaridae]VDC32623.1 Competence protein A [Filibacter tadaridae]